MVDWVRADWLKSVHARSLFHLQWRKSLFSCCLNGLKRLPLSRTDSTLLFIALFSHGNVRASEVHCQVKTVPHTVTTQEAHNIPCVMVFTMTMLPSRPAAAAWNVRKAAAARLRENKTVLRQWERTEEVRRLEAGSKIRVFVLRESYILRSGVAGWRYEAIGAQRERYRTLPVCLGLPTVSGDPVTDSGLCR